MPMPTYKQLPTCSFDTHFKRNINYLIVMTVLDAVEQIRNADDDFYINLYKILVKQFNLYIHVTYMCTQPFIIHTEFEELIVILDSFSTFNLVNRKISCSLEMSYAQQ